MEKVGEWLVFLAFMAVAGFTGYFIGGMHQEYASDDCYIEGTLEMDGDVNNIEHRVECLERGHNYKYISGRYLFWNFDPDFEPCYQFIYRCERCNRTIELRETDTARTRALELLEQPPKNDEFEE